MDRAPGLSVRLKLTLSYAGFLMIAGALLLATVWVFLLRYVPDHAGFGPGPSSPTRSDLLDAFAPRAAQAMAFLLVLGLVGGWFLAGRMLAPLTRITNATRKAATGSLSHRIELEGRQDEFRDLADSFDAMLARLEAHVAEQQRFAANASHELRTPLAVTQTLLDLARKDPGRDPGELVDRLQGVNARAIDLTEALLLLSHADQRSFAREQVDLSLAAEEATETLWPLAEKQGGRHRDRRRLHPDDRVTGALAADDDEPPPQRDRPQPAGRGRRMGHHQRRLGDGRCSPWRTPARSSPRNWRRPLSSRFSAAPHESALTTRASVSAWRSSRASSTRTTAPSPSPHAPVEGSASPCSFLRRHRMLTDDERTQGTRSRCSPVHSTTRRTSPSITMA